jgi:hypothetical protein
MRVVAIFLAMLAVSTMAWSAQCVVRCSEPPHHSTCHGHNPKQVPAKQPDCDSLMATGEALSPRLAIPLFAPGFTAGVINPDGPPLTAVWSMNAIRPWEAPPPFLSAAHLLVLRI